MLVFKLFAVILIAQGAFSTKQGPILAWEHNTALPAISSNDFNAEQVLSALSTKHKLVIFYQDGLAVEDITVNADSKLKDIVGEKFLWLPSVASIPAAVKDLPVTDIETIEKDISSHEQLVFKLPEQGFEQSSALYNAKNADIIKSALSKIKSSEVIAVLTGSSNAVVTCDEDMHVMVKRHALAAEDNAAKKAQGKLFNITNDILMYTTMVTLSIPSGKSSEVFTLDLNGASATGSADVKNATIKLKFPDNGNVSEVSVEMDFAVKNGWWEITRVEGTAKPKSSTKTETYTFMIKDLSVPEGYSYTCNDAIFRTDVKTNVHFTFHGLQVEAFPPKHEFSAPYDCLGVLSIPIWMGLIVTLIFTIIIIIGSMVLMSIKTMDKFDDPKGKTITIPTVD